MWKYEHERGENNREDKQGRPPRIPKTLGKFRWRGANWERNLDLWGTFEEAIGAFERDARLQGWAS